MVQENSHEYESAQVEQENSELEAYQAQQDAESAENLPLWADVAPNTQVVIQAGGPVHTETAITWEQFPHYCLMIAGTNAQTITIQAEVARPDEDLAGNEIIRMVVRFA